MAPMDIIIGVAPAGRLHTTMPNRASQSHRGSWSFNTARI